MTSSAPTSLEFDRIQPYQDRRFVPEDADLLDVVTVKGLYRQLIDRPVSGTPGFEQWIQDRSELEAALDQAGSIVYIRMTCQTDDQQRAEAYTHFIETISPAVQPLDDRLNNRFLELLDSYPLDEERYSVYIRDVRTQIELFKPENVELQKQVSLLSQEYQRICGAMTVEFDGREQTLPQMSKYQLELDRDLRERAWRAVSERRAQDSDALEDLFDKMLAIRHQIARNAGFPNFMEYKFKSLHRFDYTPDDCKQYHATVEKLVVPYWRQISERRRETMQLERLRPWDGAVDPQGRPPLKPFSEVADLISGCERVFARVDPEFGEQFAAMSRDGLLDLASRKGKAPGGYQSSLDEARRPFVFMNAVGVNGDVFTLLHEGGHSFHTLACRHDPLIDYRHGPMEFNEVASMAMELMGAEHLDEFYSPEDKERARTSHFEDVVYILPWVALIDAFQHWIYENPGHSRAERRSKWVELFRRFNGGGADWSGLEAVEAVLWHRQLHIFEVPFYYIEYGIAQLGALQVWRNARQDGPRAVQAYKDGLAAGGALPVTDIYSRAGIKFCFTEDIIAPLMDAVREELNLGK